MNGSTSDDRSRIDPLSLMILLQRQQQGGSDVPRPMATSAPAAPTGTASSPQQVSQQMPQTSGSSAGDTGAGGNNLFQMLRARAQIGGGGLPQYNRPLPSGATDYIANGPNGVALGPQGQTLATPTPGGGWQGTGMTGPGVGGEMGNLGAAQAATAIGGIGSALAQGAQTAAAAYKPWQIQPSHIPNPPSAPPTVQFAQQQPQQQTRPSYTENPAFYGNYFPFA